MIKGFLFFAYIIGASIFVGSFVVADIGTAKNYYSIDGLHEDNSVIKLWYTVLGLLDEYDKGLIAGFEIVFNHDGKHFSAERGANWWTYYFAFTSIGSSEQSEIIRLARYKRSIIRFNTACTMKPERAYYLLNTYVVIQPVLQERLNDIKARYWPNNTQDNKFVIGIYYQDTIMPEVQQSWTSRALYERVKEELEKMGVDKILLFSSFSDFAINFSNYFDVQSPYHHLYDYVSCLQNTRETTPAQRGEHELLTLLLLSQCNLVIAPGSYQGIGAKMLNPGLELKELDIIPYAMR